jgi:hypothetical protein
MMLEKISEADGGSNGELSSKKLQNQWMGRINFDFTSRIAQIVLLINLIPFMDLTDNRPVATKLFW